MSPASRWVLELKTLTMYRPVTGPRESAVDKGAGMMMLSDPIKRTSSE